MDRLSMHPYFIFKDAITVFVFLILFCFFVFFSPNTLGHPDNYIPEILKLLNEKDNVNNNEDISSNEEEFKELINGLFQAEGNVELNDQYL
ncbi:hypothetical protein DAPK24_040500 (mitochondrion) [Pichia kluyveri]|uniref:Cytochrome b n=1 Tax=Pichia kluyveri TaxID=36015 RepID=A0AAV5RD43_PICKL|nr:hypothetical protein DAPK24_040500 [Pichia kluyveri]